MIARPAPLLLLLAVIGVAGAFTPMKRSSFVAPPHAAPAGFPTAMFMSAEAEAEALREQARKLREEVAAAGGSSVEEQEAVVEAKKEAAAPTLNADGTLYDDEVEEYKNPLSDTMRERLMKEASTGLDADKKQTNVILYIGLGVAILVLLGGQGILF